MSSMFSNVRTIAKELLNHEANDKGHKQNVLLNDRCRKPMYVCKSGEFKTTFEHGKCNINVSSIMSLSGLIK